MRCGRSNKSGSLITILTIVGGIVLLIGCIVAVVKFLDRDKDFYDDDDWDMDFEDGNCDENGCYYSDDSEFEE